MTGRSEKALVRDGMAWVRAGREALGWSAPRLAVRCRMMQRCTGTPGPAPRRGDVAAFEAGEIRQLPRWLVLVQDVFAFMEVRPEDREAWLDRRDWFHAEHPVDLSEILVHRDEYRLLAALRSLDEPDRRAWRTLMARWGLTGGGERDRTEVARDWLRRVGVPFDVMSSTERRLLDDFRRLPAARRDELAEAVRERASWPPLPDLKLDGDELDLLAGYRTHDGDGRDVLLAMARNPRITAWTIEALKKAFPPKAGTNR